MLPVTGEGRVLTPRYDRDVLIEVLIYHHRVAPGKGCGCGWGDRPQDLGCSWADHVATVYEESLVARHA